MVVVVAAESVWRVAVEFHSRIPLVEVERIHWDPLAQSKYRQVEGVVEDRCVLMVDGAEVEEEEEDVDSSKRSEQGSFSSRTDLLWASTSSL